MTFNKAFGSLKPAELFGNDTANITQLPANIIEAFIQGYPSISHILRESLGIDVTYVVFICFLIFGVARAVLFLWEHIYHIFETYFTSSISIESDDDIYDDFMYWLSHRAIFDSRNLIAKTDRANATEEGDVLVQKAEADANTLLNFHNYDAKVPPKYEPSYVPCTFFHDGRKFVFKRESKPTMSPYWEANVAPQDFITLICNGRSPQPIKDVLKESRVYCLAREKSCTTVRRPASEQFRSRGQFWRSRWSRPTRPLDTVVLDHDQKDRVLKYINEYLKPKTYEWYAERGIPYRRGYLFAGPPGTGKSSLAWAIAGAFGLDIYCISLVEPTLTDEDLALMFTDLPRHCVVLLEDIDSAGLIKRQEPGVKVQNNSSKKHSQGISLSGLLNAIDGVASHEGRVLVMTSNFPEKLDDALIRPGRIDMRVDFTMATRPQISELFTRMYSPHDHSSTLTMSKLEKAGKNFAVNFPEKIFTPAEVQGYLLRHKNDSEKALHGVKPWINQVMKSKQEKSKMGRMP